MKVIYSLIINEYIKCLFQKQNNCYNVDAE